jgi:hypothetical protein
MYCRQELPEALAVPRMPAQSHERQRVSLPGNPAGLMTLVSNRAPIRARVAAPHCRALDSDLRIPSSTAHIAASTEQRPRRRRKRARRKDGRRCRAAPCSSKPLRYGCRRQWRPLQVDSDRSDLERIEKREMQNWRQGCALIKVRRLVVNRSGQAPVSFVGAAVRKAHCPDRQPLYIGIARKQKMGRDGFQQ